MLMEILDKKNEITFVANIGNILMSTLINHFYEYLETL